MKTSGKSTIGFVLLLVCVAAAGVLIWLTLRPPSDSTGNELGKNFEYDLEPLKKVDPALLKWRELEPVTPGLKNLHALAIGPEDRLCVAGDQAIVVFNSNGQKLYAIDLTEPAKCLAVDTDGRIFAGMKNHVEVYDPGGAKTAAWPSLGENALLTSITVGDQSVFVADALNHLVIRFDTNGKELNRIDGQDASSRIDGFFVPSPYFDLAADDGDSVWVADPGRHRLVKYRANGEFVSSWARPSADITGFCGCCNPAHIALRIDGSFVTSEKGLERVKIHAPTGDLVEVVAGPDKFEEGTVGLDLAVDSRDRIFVLDPTKGTVRIFVAKDQSE